jgi:hypothetical protein
MATMSLDVESVTLVDEAGENHTLRLLGWFSVGMAVAALSFWVGRELRSRYKFSQRTPYDFYSNSAESQAAEFGMGI